MHTASQALSAALLTVTGSLIAQAAVPTQAQLMRGVLPETIAMPHAPSLLLTSSTLGVNTTVRGIGGVLQLDASRMQSIPLVSERVFEARLRLRNTSAAHVYYQILRFDERGNGSLSRLREFGVDRSMQFRQKDSAATCRARVLSHISEVAGTDMAEGWDSVPRIVATNPIYRPDVRGVAYYEFVLDQGGFVIAATGEHDRVISSWTSVGRSKTAQLKTVASAVVAKFYKLDTLTYVGEDASGKMVSRIGNLPDEFVNLPAVLREGTPTPSSLDRRAWRTWTQLKSKYATTYRPFLRQMRDRCATMWRIERQASSATPMSWSSWRTYTADGGTNAQPLYYQQTYGNCHVGCGPVAWAIVFGWADRQAHFGNSYWSGRTGIYRTNGGYTGAATIAPISQNSGIENVTEELNRRMGTWCIGSSGATWPSRMDDADDYLSGRTGADAYSAGSDIGANFSSYRDQVRNSIRDRDTPAVMGTGFLNHYPVAYKYRYRSKTDFWGKHYQREFYVNNGWGSTDTFEWVDDGTFVYGILKP